MTDTTQNTPTPEQSQEAPVSDNPEAVEQTEVKVEDLIPSGPYQTDPLFTEIATYFAIDSDAYDEVAEDLSDIAEYMIRKTKTNNPGDILMQIKKLENRMDPPAMGERRYKNVKKFIKFLTREEQATKARRALERGL